MERLCGCLRERLVNFGAGPAERASGTALFPSTACGKQFCAAGPADLLLFAPQWACPVTPRRGRREVTPPGGPAGHGRGPLPGARSAGGSAGGFFGRPALLLAGA